MENIDQNPTNFTTPPEPPKVENKKMTAALCALLVGGFGVHKFILGYNTQGGIMLGVTLSGIILSFCVIGMFWVWIPGTIALIEGIIYITKTDEEFFETYQKNKKPWF